MARDGHHLKGMAAFIFTYESLNNCTTYGFIDLYELDNGLDSQNQEIISVVNSCGFQTQNQPHLITNTENTNDGQITNTTMMNGNEEKVDFNTEFMQKTNPRTMEKERVKNDNVGASSYTSMMTLSRETVTKYFYMPIKQETKELNIGTTLLKKRCRYLGIYRWSRLKLMSLQTLFNNV
ncbi:unnamed protein product [Lactuca saligna]|uniref:RWP-RK domain-containing protein n=1 Tax=Lactuca saligna TaxID=75948 RepID=A0AA36DYM1_LACSI|nr:unnamed protein product [Lactuca saligna]